MTDFINNLNGTQDWRVLFIEKMKEFSETLKKTNGLFSINMILAPYLSSIGLSNLVNRLDNDGVIKILNEAADAAENYPNTSGVLFGYHSNSELNIVVIDLKQGNTFIRKEVLDNEGNTNLEFKIDMTLKKVSRELDMIPLYLTTSILNEQ